MWRLRRQQNYRLAPRPGRTWPRLRQRRPSTMIKSAHHVNMLLCLHSLGELRSRGRRQLRRCFSVRLCVFTMLQYLELDV